MTDWTRSSRAVDGDGRALRRHRRRDRERRHRADRHRRDDRPGDFERTIEINLLGVWRTVRAALPHVIARQRLHPPDRVARGGDAPAAAGALRGHEGGRRGVLGLAARRDLRTPARRSASPTSASSTPTWSRESLDESRREDDAREHARAGQRASRRVESAGRAIVRAIERRARKAYAPRWVPIRCSRCAACCSRCSRGGTDDRDRARRCRLADAEAAAARAGRAVQLRSRLPAAATELGHVRAHARRS